MLSLSQLNLICNVCVSSYLSQQCYFGTSCDARLIRDTPAPIPAPVSLPEANQDTAVESDTTTMIQEEDMNDEANNNAILENATISTGDEVVLVDNGLSGNSNFCGATYTEAIENCTRELHCPVSFDLLNESLPFPSLQYILITHVQFTIHNPITTSTPACSPV